MYSDVGRKLNAFVWRDKRWQNREVSSIGVSSVMKIGSPPILLASFFNDSLTRTWAQATFPADATENKKTPQTIIDELRIGEKKNDDNKIRWISCTHTNVGLLMFTAGAQHLWNEATEFFCDLRQRRKEQMILFTIHDSRSNGCGNELTYRQTSEHKTSRKYSIGN